MKTFLLTLSLFFTISSIGQITTPIIKAGVGVDGDLRTNFFNGFVQSGNDDWFNNGTAGTGRFIIDTSGAAAVVAGYLSDASPWPRRMASLYRPMSVPQFSVINNRLWLDALFVRDYHASDTTVFTSGSDKNGMSPADWTGGIQAIPDKNDILDMFVHVRRAGPNRSDSLWMFGALALDNTTGNRYFDFEMYQTDIYYDRVSGNWYGFGADAGHTSWVFDAAGNILRPGDIIFSAEYQSSTLTNIEARIWIDRASLSISPVGFNWSGQFDGASAGAQYGYASILPKTAGNFYTGLGSGTNTWAGPFQTVSQSNALSTTFGRDQFMEFSVNLTKLGLDPVTLLGGDVCGSPFNRIVVKTRASASFTAELKDFVAPTDLFLAPRVDVLADVPIFCGAIGVSTIQVTNPSSTSVYTWTTPDGNIVGTTNGTSITADAPGTYIVMQQLAAGCNPYAYDTLTIAYDATCVPMENNLTLFKGDILRNQTSLVWETRSLNDQTTQFEVQRSLDGRSFFTVGVVQANLSEAVGNYNYGEDISGLKTPFVFYRLKLKSASGAFVYSSIVRLGLPQNQKEVLLFPNPVYDVLQLSIPSSAKEGARLTIYDISGKPVRNTMVGMNEGSNLVQLDASGLRPGAYLISISTQGSLVWKKFIVSRTEFK
jgi:hypothetical protein